MKTWSNLGLVKTRRVIVDTTAQPKNIAYPTDADLLHRIREKILKQIDRVRKEVTLRKPFRSFRRTGKKLLLHIKKFSRKYDPQARKEKIQKLQRIVKRVVDQAAGVANALYARGHKDQGRKLNQLVSIGRRIVNQTSHALRGEPVKKRLYSLHERDVANIRKREASSPR